MAKIISICKDQKEKQVSIEESIIECNEKFNHILEEVLEGDTKEAHEVEESLFRRLMELGFLLLKLFFLNQDQGDYGETIKTPKGIAKRGRVSIRTYFSIFGKLKIGRYLYHRGKESFAPLDIKLNLPLRCYSCFLVGMVSLLTIKEAYEEGLKFLKRFLRIRLSVAAAETISHEGSLKYRDYYEGNSPVSLSKKEGDITVVSFDGKGVPMIKEEAAKIKARQGKGEKRQKKKEALVGVKYTITAKERTPEEVAQNLVFPEDKVTKKHKEKAQDIRYIASIERPKKEVMEEIKETIKDKNFDIDPLVCLMDGAPFIWKIFKEVFRDILNKVLILDIIHVVEYIWLIAHCMYKERSVQAKQYVYEKLLIILKGGVVSYINELEKDIRSRKWEKSKRETFEKVITYLKNHKEYMQYDLYLSKGYPIGTGVVESACGHVVKNRMEITGARWGLSGAESILRLRSISKSNDWDTYWQFYIKKSKHYDFIDEPKLKQVA